LQHFSCERENLQNGELGDPQSDWAKGLIVEMSERP
jgi:hypothetical protein